MKEAPLAWKHYTKPLERRLQHLEAKENQNSFDKHEASALRHVLGIVTQPQRTWVGLTDEEIVDAYDVARVSFKRSQQGIRGQMLTSRDSPDWHYAKAIEAKLKEKNT